MSDDPYPPQRAEPVKTGDDLEGVGIDDEIVRTPRPWWMRVLVVLLAIVLVLFLTPALAHIFFRPINPSQGPPPNHFGSGCWACHDINAGTPVRRYD